MFTEVRCLCLLLLIVKMKKSREKTDLPFLKDKTIKLKWLLTLLFIKSFKRLLVNVIKMKYYCDGFLLGNLNPSKKGGGYTIVDEIENIIHREVIKKENFTNNEAEILGIYEVLKLAKEG